MKEIFVVFYVAVFVGANADGLLTNLGPCAKTHYVELGIETDADRTDIKKAFRRTSLESHPDRGGDKDKFLCVRAAYDTLADDAKRQVYDTSLWFMELARNIEDPSQGACANRTDKEDCVAELEDALKNLFKSAMVDGSADEMNQHFDFEKMKTDLGYNFTDDEIFREVMQAAWANFTNEHPKTAFVLKSVWYVHSFALTKMLLAFYGSYFHQIWLVWWMGDQLERGVPVLTESAKFAAAEIETLTRKLKASGKVLLAQGQGALIRGKIFVQEYLDKLISLERIEDAVNYVSVDDIFGGDDMIQVTGRFSTSFAGSHEIYRYKCCCRHNGKCTLTQLLSASTAKKWYQVWNLNGCGHLVGTRWSSYKRLGRSCEISEAEATKLRAMHKLPKQQNLEL